MVQRLEKVKMNQGVNFTLLEKDAIWPRFKYSVETLPLTSIEDIGNSSDRHEIIEPLTRVDRTRVTGAPEAVVHVMSTVNGRNGFYFYDRRKFWNSVQSLEPSDYAPGSRSVLIPKKGEDGTYSLDLAPETLFQGKVFSAGDVAEPHVQRVSNATTPLYLGDFKGLGGESAASYMTKENWRTDWYKNFDSNTQPIPDPYSGFYKDDSWAITLSYGGSDPENLDQVATADLRIHSTINSLYLLGWRYSSGTLQRFGAWRGGVDGPGPLIRGGYGMTGNLTAGSEAHSTYKQGKMVETDWQYKDGTTIGASWGVNISSTRPWTIRFDAMGTTYTSEVINGASRTFVTMTNQPVTGFFGLGLNRELWQKAQNGFIVPMSAWQHARSWAWRYRSPDGDLPVYVDDDPPEGRLDRSYTGVDGPWQNYGYLDANYNLVVVYQRDGDGRRSQYVKNLGKLPVDISPSTAEVIGGFPDLYNNHVVFIVRGYNEDLGWFVAGVVDTDPGDGDLDDVEIVTPEEQSGSVCTSGKVEFGPVAIGLDKTVDGDFGYGVIRLYFRIMRNGEPISRSYFNNHFSIGAQEPKMRGDGLVWFTPCPASDPITKELNDGWWRHKTSAGSNAFVDDEIWITLYDNDAGEEICRVKTVMQKGDPKRPDGGDPGAPPKSYYKPFRSNKKIRSSSEGGKVDLW